MDELEWELLTEIQGRWQADLLKAYFSAYGVDVELFQETAGQLYPTSLDILGRVQIFVSKKNSKAAQKLLKEYYNADEPKKEKRSSVKKRLKSPLRPSRDLRKHTKKKQKG